MPSLTWHAQLIVSGILTRTYPISVGKFNFVDDVETETMDIDGGPCLGESKIRRRIGSPGEKTEKLADALMKHVDIMSSYSSKKFDEVSPRSDLFKDLRQELTDAKHDLAMMNAMLQQLLNRQIC